MSEVKKLKRKDKRELIIHAFTHDLSKFRPSEFIPYARYFYGSGIVDYTARENFEKAWKLHYERNKHHPEHYQGIEDMPLKYIRQMVCDLKAMSLKFGGTAQEYYMKNYFKWDITRQTRFSLEIQLDLIKRFNEPICECNEECWMTIQELVEYDEEYFNKNKTIRLGSVEASINNLLKPACDTYNIDIYDLFIKSRSGM
jgi:hypothetical protein